MMNCFISIISQINHDYIRLKPTKITQLAYGKYRILVILENRLLRRLGDAFTVASAFLAAVVLRIAPAMFYPWETMVLK